MSSSNLSVVATGDISDGWEITVEDNEGNYFDLSSFTCTLCVVDMEGSKVVNDRSVPMTDGSTTSFMAYLMDTETTLLLPKTDYQMVAQVENLALPKPIKKEVIETFTTRQGFIA